MIRHYYSRLLDLRLIAIAEPYVHKEIDELIREMQRADSYMGSIRSPVVFDVRYMNLSRFSGPDMNTRASQLRRITYDQFDAIAAYVVGNESDFGMMRMYTTYLELAGLRREENILVTREIDEAAEWMARRFGSRAETIRAFLLGERSK